MGSNTAMMPTATRLMPLIIGERQPWSSLVHGIVLGRQVINECVPYQRVYWYCLLRARDDRHAWAALDLVEKNTMMSFLVFGHLGMDFLDRVDDKYLPMN